MEAAKKVRTATKTRLTVAANKLAKFDEKSPKEDIVLAIENFHEKLKLYDEAQSSVELLTEEEDLVREVEEAEAFREEKQVLRAKALKFIAPKKSENTDSTIGDENSDITKSVHANLPKLSLPTFSGDLIAWQGFFDSFKAIIDDRKDLSDINKFSYLLASLKDEAKACLKGLSLTATNYTMAKDILQRRFGRKEKIIQQHIQCLLNISGEKNLWKLYDEVQVHVRSLATLGVDGDSYGLVLAPIILHHLPSEVRLEWARQSEGREGELSFLLEFLYSEIQNRERSQITNEVKNKDLKKNNFKPSAAALVVKKARRPTCVFCKSEHWSDKCELIKNLDYDQRLEKIRKLNLCFLCLGHHHASQCTQKHGGKEKVCYHCKGHHHQVLCKKHIPSQPEKNSVDSHLENECNSTSAALYTKSENKSTIMQVIMTKINGNQVNIMFDSGSDRSFITTACAKKLKLTIVDKECLSFCCFGEDNAQKNKMRNVFEITTDNSCIKLLEISTICSTMYRAPVPQDMLNLFDNKCILFQEDYAKGREVSIDILIGLDWYWSLIKNQISSMSGLVAQQTSFGWMLSGAFHYNRNSSNSQSGFNDNDLRGSQVQILFCQTAITDEVRTMWDLDCIGISGKSESDIKDTFLETFNRGVTFKEGRYEVKLPWKSEDHKTMIVNNVNQAEIRLKSMVRRLDPDLRQTYSEVFDELEKDGIIEEIDPNSSISGCPIFYLPHRPVVRESSNSTKVRPVFDASAKGYNGVSVNDCMETGPKLIPDLLVTLLRFRRWQFGLVADIKKAFLQIGLNESDREIHRFLLLKDDKIRHMRFNRVTFGNSSSPFILNAVIKLHLEKYNNSHTVEELKSNLYVDDWLTGADSEDLLIDMMSESGKIMIEGGFILTKWASNSCQVKLEMQKSFEQLDQTKFQKVLGMAWDTAVDCFNFETKYGMSSVLFTKRSLLRLIARQFDPLGLLTPFTISLKILFQNVWKEHYDWDTTLPIDVQSSIQTWLDDLDKISKWNIPRRVTMDTWSDLESVELFVFADASEKAYGTCIYLKSTGATGTQVRLVTSKVRVAPLKKVTLPRLELLSALLGARLLNFVINALQLPCNTPYHCFTDSMIAKAWIQGDPHKWKQFVRNRVQEITVLTDSANWFHCPGKENPADLLTRGVKASVLMNSHLWMQGPSFVLNKKICQLSDTQISESEMRLLKEEELMCVTAAVAPVCTSIFMYERFGNFNKLLKVTLLVLRFICKLKAKCQFPKQSGIEETQINVNFVRKLILKDVQMRKYQTELEELRRGCFVGNNSSLLNLSPFLDEEGFIRVRGRLSEASDLTYEEKHPIILPKCHVTYLLVKAQHVLLKHAGVETLMSSLRCQYWIISVRSLAKQVVKQCVRCKRFDSRPLNQVTAPLPHDRVTQAPPFAVTGLDHAGPLYCSDTGEQKLSIVLFTCSITRALHLELVDSLSLDDFLLAFRRFVARRALPNIVYSDNAKTFKAAKSLLENYFSREIVWWKNICPLSPNWGGWWERLVRTVKSSLKKTLGKSSVTRRVLETILPEIEACVNSRPLMYIAEGKILTPSHFLIGRGTPFTSIELENFQQVVSLSARKEFEDCITKQFWELWKVDYLRNLPPLSHKSKKGENSLNLNSVVLIKDQKKPRLVWSMGRVTKLFKGIDGKVRAVQLKTEKGFLVRSINHLCLLEDSNKNETPFTTNNLQGKNSFSPEAAKEIVSEISDQTVIPKVVDTQVEHSIKTRSGRHVKPTNRIDL